MHYIKTISTIDDIFIESVDSSALEVIKPLNKKLFGEERIINDFNRKDLILLVAYAGNITVGFKIGYGLTRNVYYSAKSGTLTGFRRKGIATKLLNRMMLDTKKMGYKKLIYDTFPNKFPGMMSLGLKEGFRPVSIKWNETYGDYLVRMEREL